MGKWADLAQQGAEKTAENKWSNLVQKERGRGGASGSFGPTPWTEAIQEGFSNIPGSAWENLKNMFQAVAHPVQTVKGLGGLAAGAAEYMVPGEQKHEKYMDAMVDFFVDRYGSVENFKKTIAEDPVGVLVDAASVLYPAGKGVQIAGTAGKMGKVAQAGKAMSRAAAISEPVSLAYRGMVAPVRIGLKVFKTTPSKLYQSAAKFSTVLTPAQRKALTFTALDHQIMPTRKGLYKVGEMINELNTEITGKIDAAARTGQKINIKDLFKDYGRLYDEASLSGRPMQAKRALSKIREDILKANKEIGREALTPQQTQQLKQTIYRELETYYSSVRESPIAAKAQKAVARAAKESLEEIIPEIKQLNIREGALLELRDAIQRSASRITNRDILGIGVPIKGAAGGTGAGAPGVVAGLAFGVLDTPHVKAKLGIVLHRLKEKGVVLRNPSAAIRLGLYQAGQTSEFNPQEQLR